jgi:hypothetical protein
MRKHTKILTILLATLSTSTLWAARGAKGNTLALSSGIAFSAPSDAVFLNPANLADGSMSMLRGVWVVDSEVPMAHLTGSSTNAGFGMGYIKQADGGNFFEAGLGFNLNSTKLGFSLNSTNGEDIDGDVGLNIDLAKTRLAIVAKGVSGQMDRLDFGIGFFDSQYRFEFDIKKPSPFDSATDFFDSFLFDFGFAVNAHPFTLSLGTDFSYANSEFSDFDFHAGLDIALGKSFSILALYRGWPQERGSSEWIAGLKYTF